MVTRETITKLSITHLKNTLETHQIIILYPQIPYRNLYFSYLLGNADGNLLYCRLHPTDTTIQQMVTNIAHEGQLTITQTPSVTELSQSLTHALEQQGEAIIVYLDELDHLTIDQNYVDFFDHFLTNLPDNVQLVVNSRTITIDPWRKFIFAGNAAVLGNERRQSALMFQPDDADKPQLEIYAFGQGRAIINGREIKSWDGALPRNLFFYFVDNELITRKTVFDVFWSELGVKEATNVFHVTKRKISERMSASTMMENSYDLTKYSGGFYRPSPTIVRHYDVAEFETTIEQASMTFNEDEQLTLYERAIGLYHAPFLLNIDMPWVHDRREKLQRLLLEALIGLARIYKSRDAHEHSLGYFMRALREKPLREDLHREVMQLYYKLGYPDEVSRQYSALEELLQDKLGVMPAPETQTLLNEIV